MQDLLDDLVGRLRADRHAAGRAVRLAQPGEQDAQVVVDLGDGADRRARALAGRLLLDADRRREAGDVLDLRLLQRGRGTAGRSSRGSRRSAAGPRRRACRSPASSCPSRSGPQQTVIWSRGMSTSIPLRLCCRAPRTSIAVEPVLGRLARRVPCGLAFAAVPLPLEPARPTEHLAQRLAGVARRDLRRPPRACPRRRSGRRRRPLRGRGR